MEIFTVTEIPLPSGEAASESFLLHNMAYDPRFMELALETAYQAYEAKEVPVGCVFVKDGQVLARGGNRPNLSLNVQYFTKIQVQEHRIDQSNHLVQLQATRHAEIEAIDEILQNNDVTTFRETDLYVTVEPCIMCASALRQIGMFR